MPDVPRHMSVTFTILRLHCCLHGHMGLGADLLTDSSDVDEIGFRHGRHVIVQGSCKEAYILSG